MAEVREENKVIEEPAEMEFFDHLGELRTRIVWSVLAFILACFPGWYIAQFILHDATNKFLKGSARLIYTSPAEGFLSYFKISLIVALFLSLPIILYQVLLFVLPGLTDEEKKYVRPVIPVSILLFVAGGCFAYYLALPVAFNFFIDFSQDYAEAALTIDQFVSFIVTFILVFGLSFQLPIVMVVLGSLGLVTSSQFKEHRRLAFFLTFAVAAVATPTPDAVTMSTVAIPLYLLYELGIIVLVLMRK